AHYDAAQAQLHAAQAATADAQVSLRDTTLVSPFSGEIVKKAVDMGAFVVPGVPTFAIANTDTVKIVVGVPDTVVRSIKLGEPVEITVDAFPARTFHARVSRMSSAADAITRNFDVEVAIPNHDRLLKVGMIGSVQLAGGNRAAQPSSLQVPLSAIVLAKDGAYGVFVVAGSKAGAVAKLQSVETGAVNGTEIAILSGLSTGDRVVTTGSNLLKDGERVEVLQ
ncbi:MAG: efflux RND transporter periplasmic adaptor subunit, partial [Acidobacteria bacterium]|nr:efflux RND transporter periplasmic adaptor subunit [Acidobacteriota bacterium]